MACRLSMSIILSLAGCGSSESGIRRSYLKAARISGRPAVRVCGTRTSFVPKRNGSSRHQPDRPTYRGAEQVEKAAARATRRLTSAHGVADGDCSGN
jgi:hypothetical protein